MARKGKIHDFESISILVRPERIKRYQYAFLIVCEDQNTEKVYFERFKALIPKETIFLEAVGTGLDPLGVVNFAVAKKQELSDFYKREVDVVWVVFDKDDADGNQAKINRFDKAIDIAKRENFELAFSNEVFELWLLLHLKDIDPKIALPRANIYEDLANVIKGSLGHEDFVYVHGATAILDKIAILGSEQDAINRAEKLINYHVGKPLISSNPITFVGRLIKKLHSWIEYFSYV